MKLVEKNSFDWLHITYYHNEHVAFTETGL